MTLRRPAEDDRPAADGHEAALRRAVADLRRRESRRRFDLVVEAGELAGERDRVVVGAGDLPALDVALRTEVMRELAALRPTATAARVIRPGVPECGEGDLAWWSAAQRAFAAEGDALRTFHVLTRYGWLDVVSGETRSWRRLRI